MRLYELSIATKDEIYECIQDIHLAENDNSSSLIKLVMRILANDEPSFDIMVRIRNTALKSITKSRDMRVFENILDLLTEFKNNKEGFEFHMISMKKMRAHLIKTSKKSDAEFSGAVKVDIVGKTTGLLFHAGPKKLKTVNLARGEIYIVAFGDHGDIGS